MLGLAHPRPKRFYEKDTVRGDTSDEAMRDHVLGISIVSASSAFTVRVREGRSAGWAQRWVVRSTTGCCLVRYS